MKEKAIITAAITGSIHTPTMSDYLPITPKQIADEAVRAYEAGAAVCHIHARDPETGMPVPDVNLMKEIITDIKSRLQHGHMHHDRRRPRNDHRGEGCPGGPL